jgi:hypothetical protein
MTLNVPFFLYCQQMVVLATNMKAEVGKVH